MRRVRSVISPDVASPTQIPLCPCRTHARYEPWRFQARRPGKAGRADGVRGAGLKRGRPAKLPLPPINVGNSLGRPDYSG